MIAPNIFDRNSDVYGQFGPFGKSCYNECIPLDARTTFTGLLHAETALPHGYGTRTRVLPCPADVGLKKINEAAPSAPCCAKCLAEGSLAVDATTVTTSGRWVNGVPHGNVHERVSHHVHGLDASVVLLVSSTFYEGPFVDGTKHGEGTCCNVVENTVYLDQYDRGKRIGRRVIGCSSDKPAAARGHTSLAAWLQQHQCRHNVVEPHHSPSTSARASSGRSPRISLSKGVSPQAVQQRSPQQQQEEPRRTNPQAAADAVMVPSEYNGLVHVVDRRSSPPPPELHETLRPPPPPTAPTHAAISRSPNGAQAHPTTGATGGCNSGRGTATRTGPTQPVPRSSAIRPGAQFVDPSSSARPSAAAPLQTRETKNTASPRTSTTSTTGTQKSLPPPKSAGLRRQQPQRPVLHIGQHAVAIIDREERPGVVMYVGPKMAQGGGGGENKKGTSEIYVGLCVDYPVVGAHGGTVQGCQYFVCEQGRGLLVPAHSVMSGVSRIPFS